MKSTKLLLLVVLFCASCATPATSAPTPVSIETFTPEPTATQTPLPTPTITPSPTQVGGGSGRLIFSYTKDEFIETFPDLMGETNVFVANLDGTNLTPITNGLDGNNYLKDVSPDGTKVLMTSTSNRRNEDAELYLVNLDSLSSGPIKLADGLPNYYGDNPSAKWINDSQIVYIGQGEAGFGIYKINADGTDSTNIYRGNTPFEILAIDSARVYWGAETKTKFCDRAIEVWWSSLDGSESIPLKFNEKQIVFCSVGEPTLVFSPDGTKIAWAEQNYLHIVSISDINNPYTIQTLSGFLILKWFPDGSKVLVFDYGSVLFSSLEEITEYYKQNPDKPLANSFESLYGIYEVPTASTLPIRNYKLTDKVIDSLNDKEIYDISPDGRQIILVLHEKIADDNFDSKLNFLNIETITLSEASGFTFSDKAGGYYGVWDVHWIP